MNELDNLIIYKQYLELIYYTETISQKYPKKEKFCLVQSIKNNTYNGLKKVIEAQSEYDKTIRIKILKLLDVDLKVLKVLVRVSYKNKYILITTFCINNKLIFVFNMFYLIYIKNAI